MNTRGTERVFSSLAAKRSQKAALKTSAAALGIELTDLAEACDVSYSTAKAWADPKRDHALPDWAMRRVRAKYPKLAAWLDSALRELGGERGLDGGSAEGTSKVLVGIFGAALSAISTGLAGDDEYDAAEATALLRALLAADAHIKLLIPQLQKIIAQTRAPQGEA